VRTIIGVTGASGAAYAVDFTRRCPGEKFLILSKWGRHVLQGETGLTEQHLAEHVKRSMPNEDLAAPFSSGSNTFDAMVVIPCSISTLAKIGSGIADSLLTRTAQVALKERRKLIVCVRETPLSMIHVGHMHTLSQAGAIIMPAAPGFYFQPQTIEDLVSDFTDKVLGVLGVEHVRSWKAAELE
jgi:flavin prenyltransferase